MLKKMYFSIFKLCNTIHNSRGSSVCQLLISKRLIFESKGQTLVANMSQKVVSYDDVAFATKNSTTYIIDVREPSEIQKTGEIPNSINIPLSEIENTLKNYSEQDFKTKFNRSKPTADTPIIFSCQSGRRAGLAWETTVKLGFNNIHVYEGSWMDWEKHVKN